MNWRRSGRFQFFWEQLLPDSSYFGETMQYFGFEVTPIVADGMLQVRSWTQSRAARFGTTHVYELPD